jgi:phenylpropionate dioxygenase-like ring-hydroxylating dioxygenase large terminal subunit
MATIDESELLTRVGPGTPMGGLMREYWIPAILSSELVSDAPPLRLMLLGEKLVAFRDSSGKVGLFDHRCPHRCASLFFGRNERDGLRCAYHGWKFTADGTCVDMPNVPPHLAHPEKASATAYRTHERNGLIWAYMGTRAVPPPLPVFEPAIMPDADMRIFMVQRSCNYLQALEGDIDTSHFGFLHAGLVDAADAPEGHQAQYALANRAPEYHVADTDWGTMYAAYRDAAPGETYWRFAHFLFPFWTMPPDGEFRTHIVARAWVPMDDTHTMFVHLSWKQNAQGMRSLRGGRPMIGASVGNDYLPNTDDWYGRWRITANADNDYLIDRETQRSGSYSGIEGIHAQDQAMTESMGGIVDHDREHLVVSDHMIARTRRRLILAARAHAAGIAPPALEHPEVCYGARSGDFISSNSMGWLEAYASEVRASANPTGKLRAAG